MMMTEERLGPFRLKVQFAERVWGKLDLAPWYPSQFERPVGETWLTGESCVIETGPHAGKSLSDVAEHSSAQLLGEARNALNEFPLLVKMLFPQEKLSVQVHPDDADAAALGGGARAKTECWYVLEAEPGATVSLGLKEGTSEQEVRKSLGAASFELLLHEEPVRAGDLIYVEAGTVHAIGPGLVLLEVQQTSDTTYRLFDYGRPRELHLETGMRVIKLQNASGRQEPQPLMHGSRLIEVPHFVVERYDLPAAVVHEQPASGSPECVVGLSGEGALIAADFRVDIKRGQAVVVPAACVGYRVEGTCSFVRCALPRP